jgi:hypothetical protein
MGPTGIDAWPMPLGLGVILDELLLLLLLLLLPRKCGLYGA